MRKNPNVPPNEDHNAFFAGVSMESLWECVVHSNTREAMDTNVEAAITAKERLNSLL